MASGGLQAESEPTSPLHWALAFVAFALLSMSLYQAALSGPMVSDDALYLTDLRSTASLSQENVAEILDPYGTSSVFTMNYAPTYLLSVAAQRTFFGAWTPGYHVVNLLLHAFDALLLAWLLRATGLAFRAALLGGLLFLVHPAQVEAVAWISQSKTLLSFAFSFGALALLPRSLPLATLLFLLSLTTKFVTATLVLPAAAWVFIRGGEDRGRRFAWIAAWCALAVAVAIPQFASFKYSGSGAVLPYEDLGQQIRTIAGIGARYLFMGFTGRGLSTWHEPPYSPGWGDPWWWAALPLGAFVLWRTAVSLRDRRMEGYWWCVALAGLAPVSQEFPFVYPVADRYLYFILPGLIGAVLCLYRDRGAGWVERISGSESWAPRLGAGLAVLVAFVAWAPQVGARVEIWTHPDRIDEDAARNYPNGTSALYLEAVAAARELDGAGTVDALRRAEALRPFSLVRPVHVDSKLRHVHHTPEWKAYLEDVARWRLELAERLGFDHHSWLRSNAVAHVVLGDFDAAIESLERAMREGGPKAEINMELIDVRQQRRQAREAR